LANAYRDGPAQVIRVESAPHYSYGVVDLSKAYRARKSAFLDRDDNPYAVSIVREFLYLKPLETLVILDRLEATDEKKPSKDVTKTFLLHFPEKPELDGSDRVLAVNGDQALRVFTLLPQKTTRRVVDEGDFQGKHLQAAYYQYRLEESHEGPKQSYFLHVLQAREVKGADVQVQLHDDSASWTIQIDHPKQGHAVVVLEKGMASRGGKVAYSTKDAPSEFSSLSERVQECRVTANGPVWGKR
jgi:hypothetical protein